MDVITSSRGRHVITRPSRHHALITRSSRDPQDSDPIGLAHAFAMALRSEKEDVVAALIDFQVIAD